jgi:uncharacterized protein YdeI (BOF family)
MKTMMIASAALLISASAFAQTGGGRTTAPGQSVVPTTPGQQYRTNGPVSGTHGASGYAPGANNPRR